MRKDFKRPEEYHTKGVKAIISLFLSSATRLRCFIGDLGDLKDAYEQELGSAINGFYTQVNGFFIKGYDTSFGGCGRDFYEYRSKLELKVVMV